MNKKQLIITWVGIILFLAGLGYFILPYFYSQLSPKDLSTQRVAYAVILLIYLAIIFKIIPLIKAVILRLFPVLGYRGVVDTQINIYNKLKGKLPEQEILNRLISSRMTMSFGERDGVERAYGYLINDNNKTLKDVIKAIINYEYFESVESKALISKIPREIAKEQKRKYMDYIEERLNK